MSLRVQFKDLPEEYDWVPSQLGAVFGRENVAQGICIKQVAILNDLLRPSGLVLHRLDMRYYRPNLKEKIKQFDNEDKTATELFKKWFWLPRAGMQGLCLSSRQDLAILDTEPVDERLGPHARLKDGGSMNAESSSFGHFPKLETILSQNHPDLLQKPFRRLHTNAAKDGTVTNEYITFFGGRAIFYMKLGCKPPFKGFFQGFWGQQGNEEEPIPDGYVKIDINTSEDMGWRLVFRGEVPHGFEPREGAKYAWQTMGPDSFDTTFVEDDPWINDTTPDMPETFLQPVQREPAEVGQGDEEEEQ